MAHMKGSYMFKKSISDSLYELSKVNFLHCAMRNWQFGATQGKMLSNFTFFDGDFDEML